VLGLLLGAAVKLAAAYWYTPYQSGLGTGASWRPRSIGKYIYARARARRAARRTLIGHPVDAGCWGMSFAADRVRTGTLSNLLYGEKHKEKMNTVTDSVQREYEALYLNRHALRPVAKTALHRVAGVPVADVLDEAFLTLWRDVTEGSVAAPLAGCVNDYINRAGWKLARRALRTGQHEEQYGLDASALLDNDDALAEQLGYRGLTPERDRFAAAFDNAVRSLSPKQREAFILTQLRGATQREAADMLGIAQRTVSERVERATLAVREALIEEDAL
jgi:RNA polymerase sigma factor (sigma-70 family)